MFSVVLLLIAVSVSFYSRFWWVSMGYKWQQIWPTPFCFW